MTLRNAERARGIADKPEMPSSLADEWARHGFIGAWLLPQRTFARLSRGHRTRGDGGDKMGVVGIDTLQATLAACAIDDIGHVVGSTGTDRDDLE